MTGMRSTMPLRLATAALAAVALASCGDDDPPAAERPAATATPAATRDPEAGRFPERPQHADDFSARESGWPRAGYRRGAYAVAGGAVLAPWEVRPATRGTLSEAAVAPPAGGAAGLLCRASSDGGTGYALLLGADASVRLLRFEDGTASTLKEHELTPNERADEGEPSLLRLACGSGAPGGPVTLGYTVNATPYGYVVDERAVDPGDAAHVGLIAQDGQAVFDTVALFLAR
jgi:hypothetical protein